jgi:hypothetical protein
MFQKFFGGINRHVFRLERITNPDVTPKVPSNSAHRDSTRPLRVNVGQYRPMKALWGLLDAGGPHRQDRDQKRCAVKNQSSAILSSTRPFPGGICITAGGIVVVYQA